MHYDDYCNDIRAIKDRETSQIIDPDVLTLEPLKVILYKSAGFEKDWFDLIDLIQRRRNAIHAYQDKDIGNSDEFYKCLEGYLCFIDAVDSRFPYPD